MLCVLFAMFYSCISMIIDDDLFYICFIHPNESGIQIARPCLGGSSIISAAAAPPLHWLRRMSRSSQRNLRFKIFYQMSSKSQVRVRSCWSGYILRNLLLTFGFFGCAVLLPQIMYFPFAQIKTYSCKFCAVTFSLLCSELCKNAHPYISI